ncbi:hypothetical protein [Gordonia sp. i37]|uniref:hypothetical protein n=1 Tax=Gordonia sp. i37 TaxID=1961707 RepID=UPI0009AE4649|nr:hypothetical protein [Gordonia sp. i37]OPX06224.1 hypothetical protein B1964_28800 [Gordonia sp. i37]
MARLKWKRHTPILVAGIPGNPVHLIELRATSADLVLSLSVDEAMRAGEQLLTTAARFDQDGAIRHLTSAVDRVMRSEGNN